MGSGEGLPEAAAGGPPACTSICIPPPGHGLISASGFTRRWKRKEKVLSPCVFLTDWGSFWHLASTGYSP